MPALLQLLLSYYTYMYLQYMNLFFNPNQLKLHGNGKSLSDNPASDQLFPVCNLQSLQLLWKNKLV